VKLGGIEWRALALPATVVTGAVGILLWFNLVRVPEVEEYLHQAHLRVLRTVGAQIKSRIDGIQGNIDLALRSAGSDEQSFRRFVQSYSADIQIRCFAVVDQGSACSSDVEQRLLGAASDPPVAQMQFDSGHPHLYIAYKPRQAVIASIELDRLFTDNLPAEREFDVLFLADADGRVIVQYSAERVELARIDKLPIDTEGAADEKGSSDDKGAPAARVVSLRDIGPNTRILVGGRSYQPYVQPLSLTMQRWKAGAENPRAWRSGRSVGSSRRIGFARPAAPCPTTSSSGSEPLFSRCSPRFRS